MLTPASMRLGERRIVAVGCLLLSAAGIAIPFVGSLGMVVVLTIFPVLWRHDACHECGAGEQSAAAREAAYSFSGRRFQKPATQASARYDVRPSNCNAAECPQSGDRFWTGHAVCIPNDVVSGTNPCKSSK